MAEKKTKTLVDAIYYTELVLKKCVVPQHRKGLESRLVKLKSKLGEKAFLTELSGNQSTIAVLAGLGSKTNT